MAYDIDGYGNTAPPPPPPPPPPLDPEAAAVDSTTVDAGSGGGTTAALDLSTPAAAAETASGASETFVADTIDGLDSDGDQVVFELRAETKVEVGVGVKTQYGYQVTVQQVGGDNPDGSPGSAEPQYEVTFDKKLLGAITGNLPFPGVDPKGELGLRTADSVTMSFDSPEDAARAVQILGHAAAEETVRDTASAASPAPASGSGPVGNPVLDDPDAQTGSTPAGNVLPGSIVLDYAADAVGPTAEDTQFLQDNITSYSTRLDARARLALEGNLANLGLEGRFDNILGVQRTVTLPQDGEQGTVTYTLIGEQQLSSKQRVVLGGQLADQFEVGFVPANRSEHATLAYELDLSWNFDPNEAGDVINGRIYPEIAAASDGSLRPPDSAALRLSTDRQDQNILDLSRTDLVRDSIELTVQDPAETTGVVFGQLLDGNLDGAIQSMGENFSLTATREGVQRDGVNVQPEIAVKAFDVIGAKGSLIVQAGTDDVYARQTVTIGGEGPVTPPPEPASDQLVVVPREGLNVRTAPSAEAERASVFDHGTFVQPTGNTATDPSGQQWIEVSGPDIGNREVTGWVASDFVQSHPEGAMDPGGGRHDPDLEAQGFVAVEVAPGDNLWDIAHANNVDFQDTLALNSGHLIDPSLIFEGDTVYLPVIGDPPAAPETTTPPAAPSDSGTGSGSTDSADSGSSDSTPPAGSADGTASGSPGSPGSSGETSGSTASAPPPSAGETPPQATDSGTPPTQTPPADTGSGGDDTASGASDDAPPTATPPAVDEAGPQGAPTDLAGRPDLDEVLETYQVLEEETTNFTPNVDTPFGEVDIPFAPSREDVTISEEDALDSLSLGELSMLNGLASYPDGEAYRMADRFYPPEADNLRYGQNDGHNDAFRHAYLSARETQAFGVETAEALGTSHEALPGNQAAREAMDLYNNELGRRIAQENPDASPEALAQLIYEAVENGEAVVIDADGNLAWSDQVGVLEHGLADDGPTLPGRIDAGRVDTGS